MRILIVGAGAIGGYFGGRLAQNGADVTFLVRPKRQRQLRDKGLTIRSRHGDFNGPVHAICSGESAKPFDLLILAVKAYHLKQAMEDVRPYVGDSTAILPLLNGYTHFEQLTKAFGADKVLGGLCFIEATLDRQGEIVQTSERHDLVFGEWDGSRTGRAETILSHLQRAHFNVTLSENVQTDIWQKYIFITGMSGITTLMQAPIGPILANAHGNATYEKLIRELVSIARHIGAPVAEDAARKTLTTTEACHYDMKSSMQRDMEKHLPVEADHLQGAWLSLAVENGADLAEFPVLTAVYANLKIYEAMLDDSC